MKRSKKLFALATAAILSLTACAKPAPEAAAEEPAMRIVTTIFPQYDFARQIAGDKAEITMLLKPGAESHSYEPSPQDIKTILGADLFVYVGGENDVWVEELLASMGDQVPETMTLIDLVPTVEEVIVEGMEHDHDHDDDHDHDAEEHHDDDHDHDADEHHDDDHDHDADEHHDDDHDHDADEHHDDDHDHDADEHHDDDHDHDADEHHDHEIDEHVWTSPRNAIAIVEALSQWMQAHDDENAAFYAQNTADYVQQLTELDSDYRTMVEHSARKTILFGDRFPFRYLADAYGLEYYAAFSGCSTETEASAQTVKFLSDKIVSDKLPVVFTIEFSNGKIADSIADATGAKRLELHSCHNLSAEQMAAGVTYLELMQQNLKALEEALTE